MPNLEQLSRTILKGMDAVETDKNGRFYLDGTMVNLELSKTIAEVIYVGEIFRKGQSVTDKYTTDTRAGALRVKLDTPIPFSSRTLGYGGRQGTEGNSGVININAPLLPSDDEFMIFLNQVNDQSMLFPDISKEYIPLDTMSLKLASYANAVIEDRSASILAEIIAYAVYRALNDGNNLNVFDKLADNAYAELFAQLNTRLDDGDITMGAHAYPTLGRCIIGRSDFINRIFNKKSGVILNGSDMAQSMLKNYSFELPFSERDYVGNNYKGSAMQFDFQLAASYIWSLAEKYLGLQAGALNNIDAIAVSYEATAVGKVIDLGAKSIDANEVRGTKIQPMNIWGHEGFRKSQLIGNANLTLDNLKAMTKADGTTLAWGTETGGTFTPSRVYPVAPKDISSGSDKIYLPIYASDGTTIVGYKEVAQVPKPSGGNITPKKT